MVATAANSIIRMDTNFYQCRRSITAAIRKMVSNLLTFHLVPVVEAWHAFRFHDMKNGMYNEIGRFEERQMKGSSTHKLIEFHLD